LLNQADCNFVTFQVYPNFSDEYRIPEGLNVRAIPESVEIFLDRGTNARLCWKRVHLADTTLRRDATLLSGNKQPYYAIAFIGEEYLTIWPFGESQVGPVCR
jgi:hypothetical protein